MNKKYILIVLILFIIFGVGFFAMKTFNEKDLENSVESQKSNTKKEDEKNENILTGSLEELLKMGKNFNCEISYTDGSGNSIKGVLYYATAGEKISGEFESEDVEGNSIITNLISDGEYSYMWSSNSAQGLKSKIDKDKNLTENPAVEDVPEGAKEFLKDDQGYDYKCKLWDVDESAFIPPTDIEFIDFEEAMKSFEDSVATDEEENTENIKEDCSACESLPEGELKKQCLSALNCL